VAEGVENASILNELAALRCDEAQGFHLARPMPVDAFTAWVAARELETAVQ
jgi:EAL domain-containing protein (putative c-di-GMP-specific phosphodiesterase class I)